MWFFKKNILKSKEIANNIDDIWLNLRFQRYLDMDSFLDDIDSINFNIIQSKLSPYLKSPLQSRVMSLYGIYKLIYKIPNGLNSYAAVLNIKSKVGYIFNKQSLSFILENIRWAEALLDKFDIFYEDDEYIIYSAIEEIDNVSNLIFISNMVIGIDNFEIHYERNLNDEITRRFYSYFLLLNNNKDFFNAN